MTPLIPAVAGALVVAGLLGLVLGLRPRPVEAAAPRRRSLSGSPGRAGRGSPG